MQGHVYCLSSSIEGQIKIGLCGDQKDVTDCLVLHRNIPLMSDFNIL